MTLSELLQEWKMLDAAARDSLRAQQLAPELPPFGRPFVAKERHAIQRRRDADAGREEAYKQLELGLSRKAIEQHIRLEAARKAVEAYPNELVRIHHEKRPRTWKAMRRHAAKAVQVVGYELKRALEAYDAGEVGPNCAPGDALVYVQEEDLEQLIPDGWGDTFPRETKQLARRISRSKFEVALLCLLTWTSRAREPHPKDTRRRGAGAQLSTAWLARKLGCCATWVKKLTNRLDPEAAWRREAAKVNRINEKRKRGAPKTPAPPRPTGTSYLQRWRRLQRYEHARQANGRQDVFWVDRKGIPHQFVDHRGVYYVTDAGVSLLQPRFIVGEQHRIEAGVHVRVPITLERRNGQLIDLAKRGMRLGLLLRRRLEHRADPVENPPEKSTSPPARAGAG